jgi:hypothetical protein
VSEPGTPGARVEVVTQLPDEVAAVLPDEVAAAPRSWLGRAYAHRTVRVGIVGVIVVGVVAVWAGRESDRAGAPPPGNAAVNAKAAVPAGITAVASAAGCTAKPTTTTASYRQAFCIVPENRLTITTFTTDQDQKDWLAEALPYGGAYLIGKRWVVGANTPDGLNKIAGTLGGTITDKSA